MGASKTQKLAGECNLGYTKFMAHPKISVRDIPLQDQENQLLRQIVEKLRASILQDGHKAAHHAADLLKRGGALVFPALRAWGVDPSPEVRKVLARVVASAADPGDPFRASFLFDLLSPLLWDVDPGVRTLARRVVRRKLLPLYPEEALQTLAQWAAEPDPAKQVFSASSLALLPTALAQRALIPLRHLARSERPKVCRAALRALKIWRNRAPQAVEAELKRWESVPELAPLVSRVVE